MLEPTGKNEKRSAALSSVFAAVGLTAIKLTVGFLTNSLGILAEAAHSALDLVAAAMTYLAVRFSDKPADLDHHFGHGKIENLSALFETLLLLGTSAWVIYEAVQRLFLISVRVESSIWSFVIMGLSIAIDFTRSRRLARAARKYHSQALEADALHFSTDIWSSAVVILGLIGLSLARFFPGMVWFSKADSLAALVVAGIVLYVSARLGGRTIAVLVDTAPTGQVERIKKAASVEGVSDVHAVRIRPSGPNWFVDLHVTMNGNIHLHRAHAATEEIERQVQEIVPGADVTVHVEPLEAVERPRSKKRVSVRDKRPRRM